MAVPTRHRSRGTGVKSADVTAQFEAIAANVGRAVLGNRDAVRLSLICLLAEAHLLIEDILAWSRPPEVAGGVDPLRVAADPVTPDLLPSDVLRREDVPVAAVERRSGPPSPCGERSPRQAPCSPSSGACWTLEPCCRPSEERPTLRLFGEALHGEREPTLSAKSSQISADPAASSYCSTLQDSILPR